MIEKHRKHWYSTRGNSWFHKMFGIDGKSTEKDVNATIDMISDSYESEIDRLKNNLEVVRKRDRERCNQIEDLEEDLKEDLKKAQKLNTDISLLHKHINTLEQQVKKEQKLNTGISLLHEQIETLEQQVKESENDSTEVECLSQTLYNYLKNVADDIDGFLEDNETPSIRRLKEAALRHKTQVIQRKDGLGVPEFAKVDEYSTNSDVDDSYYSYVNMISHAPSKKHCPHCGGLDSHAIDCLCLKMKPLDNSKDSTATSDSSVETYYD